MSAGTPHHNLNGVGRQTLEQISNVIDGVIPETRGKLIHLVKESNDELELSQNLRALVCALDLLAERNETARLQITQALVARYHNEHREFCRARGIAQVEVA